MMYCIVKSVVKDKVAGQLANDNLSINFSLNMSNDLLMFEYHPDFKISNYKYVIALIRSEVFGKNHTAIH